MPVLTADAINDLVKSSLAELSKGDITEIAADQSEYTSIDVFFKPNMRKRITSGTKVQWNVLTEANENTEYHGLYHEFDVQQHDGLVQASIPWTQATMKVMWDDAEIQMNMEPAKITDLMTGRWRAAVTGFAATTDNRLWNQGAGTADPRSIPYYVVKTGATTTPGFNGTVLSGYTAVAELSPTTYPNWRNGNFLYTDVIESDFIEKLTSMMRLSHFVAPNNGKKAPSEHGSASPDERMFFTNNVMLGELEHLARSRNDNLGAGLLAYMGEVTVGRRPVRYAPGLDADTTNPFYGVHTGTFKTAHLGDRWNATITIERLPKQPSVGITYVNYMHNLICYNRRRSFVGATATTYPS